MEGWPSGLRRTLGKRVYFTVTRIRIPLPLLKLFSRGNHMSDQRVFLDDIYASEKCGGSVFRAVVMMAHEARFINEQARLGYLQLTKKPTTIAMYKFKEDKLSIKEKVDEPEVTLEADSLAPATSDIDLPSEKVDEAADAAFGE